MDSRPRLYTTDALTAAAVRKGPRFHASADRSEQQGEGMDLALLIKSGGLEKRRILDALNLTFTEEELTASGVGFLHEWIGRSRFVPLQRNAAYPPTSQRCCDGAAVS